MQLPTPPLPPEIWATVPPAAQALILALLVKVARVDALEAEVKDLKARLDKNSSNSHKPPSSDPPSFKRPSKPKSGRKRGGQPGHPGHFRALLPPERVDEPVDYFPAACRDCGDSLAGAPIAGAPFRHQVCEIPPIAVTVIEHRLHRRQCPCCGAVTTAEAPSGVLTSCFGPNLEGLIGTLVGRYRLSRRNAQQLIHDLTDVRVSLGTVVAIGHRVAAALTAPVEAIARAVRQSPYAHVDETGFKEAGQRRYLWVASTKGLSYFRILGSRSRDDRRKLLGDLVPGQKLITDRLATYLDVPDGDWAVCHAHLKRDFKALKGRNQAADEFADAAIAEQRRLFTLHREIRAGTVTPKAADQRRRMLKARFGRLLIRGLDTPDAKVRSLSKSLDGIWPALFTCLDHSHVDPTNNEAERDLRPGVIWRKTSFGTASAKGNTFAERLLTVSATCRKQGRNVFEYVTEACRAARHGLTPPALLPV